MGLSPEWSEPYCKSSARSKTQNWYHILSFPSVTQNIPWFRTVLVKIPYIGDDTKAFGQFAVEQSKKRYALIDTIKRKDLIYHLASAFSSCLFIRPDWFTPITTARTCSGSGYETPQNHLYISIGHRRRVGHHQLVVIEHFLLPLTTSLVYESTKGWTRPSISSVRC